VALVASLLIAFTGFLTPAIAASPLAEDADATGPTVHSVGVEQNVRVTVHNETTAYDEGERLTNAGLYPLNETSQPTVVASAEGQQATIRNLSLVVTYEAATREDREDPFYTGTQVLETVEPDAPTASVETAVPIREVFDRQRQLQAEFGGETEITASLHTRVTYAYSPVDGPTRTESLRVGGTIERTERLVGLPHDTERKTQTTGGSAAARSDTSTLVNGLALLVGILAALGLVATRAAVSRIDAEAVERALQRRRFEEWVTEVESYTPQGNSHVVEVSSLGDLVDLAIDTGERVLSPADMEEYLVVDGNTVFRYAPSTEAKSAMRFGFSEFERTLPDPSNVLDGDSQDPFAEAQGNDGETSGGAVGMGADGVEFDPKTGGDREVESDHDDVGDLFGIGEEHADETDGVEPDDADGVEPDDAESDGAESDEAESDETESDHPDSDTMDEWFGDESKADET
ncbi:MAG: DUF5305 family protein, partial [Halanaeroarchaeum sp.]